MSHLGTASLGQVDVRVDRTAKGAQFEPTVRVSYVRLLTEYCEQRNISTASLLASVGLDVHALEQANARISFISFSKLCDRASDVLRDPQLGLRVGQTVRPGHFGPYGLALMSCGTARQQLERSIGYSKMVSDVYANELVQRGGELVRIWHSRLPGGAPPGRFHDEMRLAAGMVLTRWCWRMPDLRLNWVSFRHERPRDTREYDALFRCPIRFGAVETSVAFDLGLVHTDLREGNPEALALLDQLCERELGKLHQNDPPWLNACRLAIAKGFREGKITLEAIAARTGVAARTLRYRIEKRGESFRSLVSSLRCELALTYLADAQLSLVDIALLLGFSDQSTFQRSFKNWTGRTPGDYRRRHRSEGYAFVSSLQAMQS